MSSKRTYFEAWLSGGTGDRVHKGRTPIKSLTLGQLEGVDGAVALQDGKPLDNLLKSQGGERVDERFAHYLVSVLGDRDIEELRIEPAFYGSLQIKPEQTPDHSVWFSKWTFPSGTALHAGNLRFSNVEFKGPGDLFLTDCFIRALTVDNGGYVELTRTWVLDLRIGHLRELKISSGGVYRPSILPSEKEGPDAPYDISNDVEFPLRKPESVAIGDGLPFGHPQPMRVMLRHLAKRGNPDAYWRFYALAREREYRSGSFGKRIIGRLYKAIANFGVSWIRPILWMLLLIVVTGLWLGWTSSTEVAGKPEELPRWQSQALLNGAYASWVRGFWLAATSIINPAGRIFEAAVVPTNVEAAIILFFHFLGCALLLGLAAKAVKRHFVELPASG